MKDKSILIIAAHPDDDILGCGGYISKYRKLCEFKVIFIAEGSSSRFADVASKEADASIKQRQNMAISALEALGVGSFEFNNLPCGKLDQIPQLQINKILEKAIDEYKPSIVLTHSGRDLNQDHKIINQATLIATRPTSKRMVNSVISYEVLSSSEWNYGESFRPNLFEEISVKDLVNKQTAMKCYHTEVGSFPFPRSDIGIETLARYRGMQSGFKLAEAFEILRIFR
jgi:LmbE family N-acetylglucosaminyl deacetylase